MVNMERTFERCMRVLPERFPNQQHNKAPSRASTVEYPRSNG
jgi:hypothetical protein